MVSRVSQLIQAMVWAAAMDLNAHSLACRGPVRPSAARARLACFLVTRRSPPLFPNVPHAIP